MLVNAHFSKIKTEILKNLRQARRQIRVAVAWITDEDIVRVLSQKAAAGIDTIVIISNSVENFRTTSRFVDFLDAGGILRIASPKFLHHKFCIVDDEIIIAGSYNWTYYAQYNEENILVISIDKSLEADSKLLTSFNAKHNFLCNKSTVLISKADDLGPFQPVGIESRSILFVVDQEEDNLRQELENDVRLSLDKAQSLGIGGNDYLLERMRSDGGGVEFIKRILADEISSGEMKSGFRKLEEPIPHRVNLSLEYIASRDKYATLFTDKEIQFCKNLMRKYKL